MEPWKAKSANEFHGMVTLTQMNGLGADVHPKVEDFTKLESQTFFFFLHTMRHFLDQIYNEYYTNFMNLWKNFVRLLFLFF